MAYNENKRDYNMKYSKSHYKRVPLDLTPSKYEEVKAAADRAGESVNGYIKKSIDMRMDSSKNE